MDVIRIRGARTHNLQGIDLDLPRDRLVVITGLSGSGKSSLAFDTIYAEGQRRYVESLSAYARQFLSVMEKPDVDHIEGLSPAIAIEQKATSHNPRSTVGTVTEVYDYLRVLFARAGVPRCPEHGQELTAQSVSQMVDQVLALPEGTALLLLAPIVQDRKGEHVEAFEHLRAQGFVRAFVDGKLVELDAPPPLEGRRRHSVDAVVDRLRVRGDASQRLAESFETALGLAQGVARVAFQDEPRRAPLVFSNRYACTACGYSLAELEPRLFSFNNPTGACGTCGGLGVQEYFDPARVVINPALSLAGGAVRGWDRRNAYYFQLIQALARHYRFDIETPWGDLSEAVRHVLLHGSGEEHIEFRYFDARGGSARRSHPWEGILPNMSAATARPSRPRCARNWRSTAARVPASTAAAAGSTSRHATCSSAAGRCPRSHRCPSRRRCASSPHSKWKAGAARSRAAWCARLPTGSGSWSTWVSTTCRSIAAPRRCPAARRSASGSRARSVRDWLA
jgi:excinuclease ABC subunit A